MKTKKLIALTLTGILAVAALAGCGSETPSTTGSETSSTQSASSSDFKADSDITVVSR